MPHGMTEVAWNLSRPHRFIGMEQAWEGVSSFQEPVVLGPRDRSYLIDTRGPSHLFGIVFAPGAAFHFLGEEMGAFFGGAFSLADFPLGAQLQQQLGDVDGWRGRREAALMFFRSLPRPPGCLAVDRLLSAWQSARGRGLSVRKLRVEVGLSAPTFVRHVRRHLGLRPAQLRQVLAFRDAVEALAEGESLAATSYAAGFCDQGHLARTFRRHADFSPSAFRPQSAAHPYNVLVSEETPFSRAPFI